ncbi:MAG: aminotransferase class I/II-fold pyridoxal phosphate-dependent enzyme, partial [Alistipes sp.]|nr:aminotransferase class I/II-fold pyridoxal phosphate-dependent enzyme [Alistipes sp.]
MSNEVKIERAHRMDGTGEYYFSRRLREIAEIEASTGRQIIKLAMGSPDLPPHPSVVERLSREALRPDVHKYMSFKGEPVLRKAFADWYAKWYGVEVDYNSEVLPLIGSKEGIMHICQTFINPGDKVLVPNPGYAAYKSAVSMTGGVMLPYSLNKENDFTPDFEAIEAAGVEGVKIMFANFPGMPTGQTPTRELFEQLVAFGRKHNI